MEAKTSHKQYINDLKPEIAKRLNEAYWYIRKNTEYVNQTLIAEKIGESRSNFSAALNGNEKYVTEGLVRRIVASFPEISREWMLTGQGKMIISQEVDSYLRREREKYGLSLIDITEYTHIPLRHLKAYENEEKKIPEKVLEILENFFDRMEYEYQHKEEEGGENTSSLRSELMLSSVRVPYYDVDFAGEWSSAELFTQVRPSFVISAPDFARAEFACNLIGNAISSRIKSGAIIGLRKIEDWKTYFPTNEIYGVVTKNNLRTIKIVKRSAQKGYLDLVPAPLPEHNNPPYEVETIPEDYIQVFYQVVASASFERLTM
nr:helix-turn-helix domain-containing protein [uncultured Capnocytophaga sp.]